MRLEVNHSILSDAPYSESNSSLFFDADLGAQDLIKDIKYGSPTCYLVSGYRGAGKSSFINKLEIAISTTPNSDFTERIPNAKKTEIAFIHTNFSKYHSQNHLLRKLIRGLYLGLKDLESFKQLKKIESKAKGADIAMLLERLYEKTFYETSKTTLISDKKDNTIQTVVNLGSLIFFAFTIIATTFFVINAITRFWGYHIWGNGVLSLISGSAAILSFLDIKRSNIKSRIRQEDFNRKSLYDDEIADYHFLELLKDLSKYYKIVFVLDELDKMEDDSIDELLKEMKPYLVSGTANFIVVAGQELFYKYMDSKLIDDGLLSSIFSRCIHVALFSREEFRLVFDRILVRKRDEFTREESELLDAHIDYLVFEAKRIPRAFINHVRQSVFWEKNEAWIKIDPGKLQNGVYSKIVDVIDRIDDEEIATVGYERAVRDFLIMKLYLHSHQILHTRGTFTLDKLLSENGQGQEYE